MFFLPVASPRPRSPSCADAWGLFSMVAAHFVGPTGMVTAIEADPRVASMLHSNLARNHLPQVKVFDLAIADHDRPMLLAAHDADGGNWGISALVDKPETDQAVFSVPCRRLDPLLDEAGIQTVDLLKIDVEGAEIRVLQGMEAGLEARRYGCILLELHPAELVKRDCTLGDVLDLLRQRHYRGYALAGSPAAQRQAYYRPWRHYSELVCGLERGLAQGCRHTLWLSADQPGLDSGQ